jgi:cobalt/nickel transport system permease protein
MITMHIAEGYLPLSHALAWSAVAAPAVVLSTRHVTRLLNERPDERMRLAAGGAFVFLLSSLKLPSVGGSSSHPTGTGLGSALLGLAAMPAIATLVLLFQTMLLAHGGVSTLGANVVSLGVVGPAAAIGVFRGLQRLGVRDLVAVGIAAAVADLATYAFTAGQLALAFPSESLSASWMRFATVFGVTQIPLAVLEGVFSALVWRAIVPAPRLRKEVAA